MSPKEFTELVFDMAEESSIHDYIIEVCGEDKFNQWETLRNKDEYTTDDVDTFNILLSDTPSEVMFYYMRHFYMEELFRESIENSNAIKEIADIREMKIEGVNDV